MQTIKPAMTHVILRDEPASVRGAYAIWSQHRSEAAANKLCTAMGKNAAQGHTVVVPVSDLARYTLSDPR